MPTEQQYAEIRKGERGAWISIGAYLVLSSAKIAVGLLFASKALSADGYNNLTDIVASLAVLIGLRISQKPPDKDHPYGHFRAETVSSLIASCIMATVGIQVLISSVKSLFQGHEEPPNILTALVAVVSSAAMFVVYGYNRRLANRINSNALHAAAKDNLSDALVSIGAAIGIAGASLGWAWLDPVAALAVGVIICKTAWEIFYSSTHALTDGFDDTRLVTLRSYIEKVDGVKLIKDLKARIHGSHVLVDVIVMVDSRLSLLESHRISDEIEHRLQRRHNIMSIHVHVEPYEKV